MPIKYNQDKNIIKNKTPLVEKVRAGNTDISKAADMMSNIIKEKQKINTTSIINMIGVLTPVTYYQAITNNKDNYGVDSSGPNKIASETKKYKKINNFLIKLSDNIDLTLEGEENNKDYTQEGSCIILPRTIKPSEGDLFIMEYYGKHICYKINSVEIKTFVQDSGFECKYSIQNANYEPDMLQISEEYMYFHEFTGTTYRPILTLKDHENINKYTELYENISNVYNNLFYDKVINAYILKIYDSKGNKRTIVQNNNNINGVVEGKLLRFTDMSDYKQEIFPEMTRSEATYDNYINEFIAKNYIFRNFNELTLAVEPLLSIDSIGYRRSIYSCLETRSVANFKNTSVTPVYIEYMQPGMVSYLVGKRNVIYSNDVTMNEEEFFPQKLTQSILNGKSINMKTKCTEIVYSSIDNFIIETILRFIYKETSDFSDRLNYLYEKIDQLNEHEMSYINIFYLFPLLGYIIEKILENLYSSTPKIA